MNESDDDRPPFLGSWKRVYFAVLLYLTVLILLMYWFTRTWNR